MAMHVYDIVRETDGVGGGGGRRGRGGGVRGRERERAVTEFHKLHTSVFSASSPSVLSLLLDSVLESINKFSSEFPRLS